MHKIRKISMNFECAFGWDGAQWSYKSGATLLGADQEHRRSLHLRPDPNTAPGGPNSEFADNRSKKSVRMLKSNWSFRCLVDFCSTEVSPHE